MSYRLQNLCGFQGHRGLPCTSMNQAGHPVWSGQAGGTAEGQVASRGGTEKPPAWILPQAGLVLLSILISEVGSPFPKLTCCNKKG